MNTHSPRVEDRSEYSEASAKKYQKDLRAGLQPPRLSGQLESRQSWASVEQPRSHGWNQWQAQQQHQQQQQQRLPHYDEQPSTAWQQQQPRTSPMLSPKSFTEQRASSAFQNQLNAVQNWLYGLNEDEALDALQGIFEAFPYQQLLNDLIKTQQQPQTYGFDRSACSTPVSTIEVGFDALGLSEKRLPPLSRLGAIGQDRPASSLWFSDKQSRMGSPFSEPALHSLSRPKSVSFEHMSGAHAADWLRIPERNPTRMSMDSFQNQNQNQQQQQQQQQPRFSVPSPRPSPVWQQESEDARKPFTQHAYSKLRHPIPQIAHRFPSDHGQAHYRQSTLTPPPSANSPKHEKGRIPDEVDFRLLEDIPSWLKSLRLHKYTGIFVPGYQTKTDGEEDEQPMQQATKKWIWREMIELSDQELQDMGVHALGARRKLLKVFELVKQQLEEQGSA